MSRTPTNWHVITGGPGTGKTVLINMLANMGYATVPEVARAIIDEGLAKGLSLQEIRGDQHAWQATILQRILDTEAAIDPAALTFFDRGAHDGLAFLRLYGLIPRDHWQPIMQNGPYHTVFLLEPLSDVEQDYARIEDINMTKKLTDLTAGAYIEAGMEPIHIPFLPTEERLALILSHLHIPHS
jgi:predicted ATPase